MALAQVVRQVVLDLRQELLGVVGVEAEHLAEPLQADVLQVAVCQGLHAGVGLDHLLLGQAVRADQVTATFKVRTDRWRGGDLPALIRPRLSNICRRAKSHSKRK